MLAVKVSIPAKPLRLRTRITVGPEFPGEMNSVAGLGRRAKSAEADGAIMVTNMEGDM